MARSKKQTPAAIAESITAYMKKQQDTLSRYPVGPLANAARLNLEKANKALAALKMKNEELRMTQPTAQTMRPGGPVRKFNDGSPTSEAAAPAQQSEASARDMLMYELIGTYGYHPSVAGAVLGISYKENPSGNPAQAETSYANTTATNIKRIFKSTGKFDGMSDAEINALKVDNEAFYNHVYGGRMGNGADEGYKFRGRGLIQITGKKQYAAASQALFGDDRLVNNPDLIGSNPHIAARAAAWYLQDQGTPLSDYGIDVSKPLTDENRNRFFDAAYGKVAGLGPNKIDNITAHVNDSLYAQAMPLAKEFAEANAPVFEQIAEMPSYRDVVKEELAGFSEAYGSGNELVQEEAAPQETGGINYPDDYTGPRVNMDAVRGNTVPDQDLTQLDFDRAELDYVGGNFGTTKGGAFYGQNQHGDFNVRTKDGDFYVVRADDWNESNPDAAITRTTKLNGGAIPYLPQVDQTDLSRTLGTSFGMHVGSGVDVGNRGMDPTGSTPDDMRAFNDFAQRYGEGVRSGIGADFEDVVKKVAKQRGIEQPELREGIYGEEGAPGFIQSAASSLASWISGEPEDRKGRYADETAGKIYEEQLNEIRREIAAEPGTYRWQDTDSQGNAVERVGVGGYTPFADYVSYATNDPTFQSGYQRNAQMNNAIGDMMLPMGFKSLPAAAQAARTNAVSGGTKLLGSGRTAQSIKASGQWSKPAGAAGSAGSGVPRTIDVEGRVVNSSPLKNTRPALIPETVGQARALPAPSAAGQRAGNLVRPGQGFKFKPGTAAAGEPITLQATSSNPIRFSGPKAGISTYGSRMRPYVQPQQTRSPLGRFGSMGTGIPRTAPVNNLGSGNQVFYGMPGGQGRNALGQFTANRPGVLVPGNQMLADGSLMLRPQGSNLPAVIPKGGVPAVIPRGGVPAVIPKGGLPAVVPKGGLMRYTPQTGFRGAQAGARGGAGAANGLVRGSVPHLRGFDGRIPWRTSELARMGAIAADPYFDDREFPSGSDGSAGRGTGEVIGGTEEEGQFSVPPTTDSTGDGAGAGQGTGGEGGAGDGTAATDGTVADPKAPEKIPQFKTPLSLVPLATNMAATRAMRRSIENMQAPARPGQVVAPKFNYQSNIGQALQDSRDAARSVVQSAPASAAGMAAQQAALAQRFKQDARLRSQDNVMRQGAERQFEQLATQVRAANTAIRNQYNDDMTRFQNQREMLLGANEAQGQRNIGAYAQDYIQNVLSPQYTARIQAMGRPYDAAAMLPDNPLGMANEEDKQPAR